MSRRENEPPKTAHELDTLVKNLGLNYYPFGPDTLHADRDPRFDEYSVDIGDDEAHEKIVKKEITIVFGNQGEGKSGLRASLARQCRTERCYQQIFPIVCDLDTWEIPPLEEDSLPNWTKEIILISAAQELLSHFICHPGEFHGGKYAKVVLGDEERSMTVNFLNQYLPGGLDPYLSSPGTTMEETLRRDYDPNCIFTTRGYNPDRIPWLKKKLNNALSCSPYTPPPDIHQFASLVLNNLKQDAIYLLVDIPGSLEPSLAHHIALTFLNQANALQTSNITTKAFFPSNLRNNLRREFPKLDRFSTEIAWTKEKLAEMINQRLRTAINRGFISLSYLSNPSFRGEIESSLVDIVSSQGENNPRQVLTLVHHLFLAHLQRCGPTGKLSSGDRDQGISSYLKERG